MVKLPFKTAFVNVKSPYKCVNQFKNVIKTVKLPQKHCTSYIGQVFGFDYSMDA